MIFDFFFCHEFLFLATNYTNVHEFLLHEFLCVTLCLLCVTLCDSFLLHRGDTEGHRASNSLVSNGLVSKNPVHPFNHFKIVFGQFIGSLGASR